MVKKQQLIWRDITTQVSLFEYAGFEAAYPDEPAKIALDTAIPALRIDYVKVVVDWNPSYIPSGSGCPRKASDFFCSLRTVCLFRGDHHSQVVVVELWDDIQGAGGGEPYIP